MGDPECENPVNVDAADMLMNSPALYNQLARDAVVASKRHERGMILFEDAAVAVEEVREEEVEMRRARVLRFDDYYDEWRRSGTSMVGEAKGAITAKKLLKFKTQNTKGRFSDIQTYLDKYSV